MEGRHPSDHLRKIRQRRAATTRDAFGRLRRWVRFRLVVPLLRGRHTPEFTARGVANGLFWGLTPTVGVQSAAIVATWFVARRVLRADSSLMQAFVWVWVNNPLTMVPMYYVFYMTGLLLTGTVSTATGYDTFLQIWRADDGWRDLATRAAVTIAAPTLIGCVPYAVTGSGLGYAWTLALLRRRARRRNARQH